MWHWQLLLPPNHLMDVLLHKYPRKSEVLGEVNTASLQILLDYHLQSADNMQILRSFLDGSYMIEVE